MEYKVKWSKRKLRVQTNKDTHECPLCTHYPASKMYNHPVYGDLAFPGLVTGYFTSRMTREELGLNNGERLIGMSADTDSIWPEKYDFAKREADPVMFKRLMLGDWAPPENNIFKREDLEKGEN